VYDEKLEKLIEMALVDGVLTEKERQVLLSKGEALGVDPDELEMVLEARLYEKNRSSQQTVNPPPVTATSNKHGDVQKCPACGASIRAFLAQCDDCGHEFNNVEANATARTMFIQLQELEAEAPVFSKRERKSFTWDKSRSFIDNIIEATSVIWSSLPEPKLAKEEREKKQLIELAAKQAAFIRHYPIPNTKNDILEFLTLSVPHARAANKIQVSLTAKATAERQLTKAWRYKCEQVIVKARLSLKEDPRALEEINHYASELGIK